MDVWKLPKSVNVNGKEYRIRSDYRAVLDILCAINDPDIVAGMSEEEKNLEIYTTILAIFYEDFDNLPTEDWEEALKTAKEFIDCGFKEDKKKPQLMDWKKDAKILIPAINKVAHEDIRDKEYLHWWTFMGLFMEIGESLFSTITNIREKVSKGKKLDSWEKEFYSSNKELVDLKATPERSKEEKEELRRVFGLANN